MEMDQAAEEPAETTLPEQINSEGLMNDVATKIADIVDPDNKDLSETDVQVVESAPEPTNSIVFTTTTEQMPIKVPNRDERTFEIASQKSSKQYKPILHLAEDNGNYTQDEIEKATDNYLKNGKIQLEDSLFVAEIIEELTSRYLDLLSETEYLKANEMIEKARALRKEFKMKDQGAFWEQRLVDLESKKRDLDDQVKVVQRECSEKQKELLEKFRDEIYELEEKSNAQRANLESDWTAPEKQRQFNKQSKDLLAGRSLEKYMVLAGDLEAAEAQKRRNKAAEQKEIKSGYAEMASAFEAARDRLEDEIEQKGKDLEESQEFRKKKLKTEERYIIEYWRKKIAVVERMIQDEKRISRVVKDRRSPSAQSCELPMLKRTVQNIETKKKILNNTNTQARPLALPPLEVKRRAAKKKLFDRNNRASVL